MFLTFVEEHDNAGGFGDVCKGFDVVMFEGADLIVGLFGGEGCFVFGVFEHLWGYVDISSRVQTTNDRIYDVVTSHVRVGNV